MTERRIVKFSGKVVFGRKLCPKCYRFVDDSEIYMYGQCRQCKNGY